jgi:hypothetical protein
MTSINTAPESITQHQKPFLNDTILINFATATTPPIISGGGASGL